MKIIHLVCLYAVFALLFIVSCSRPENASHQYLSNLVKDVDSAVQAGNNGYREADIRRINNGFASVKNIAPADMAEKYIRNLYYYNGRRPVPDSAMMYADSAIGILQHKLNDEKLSERYAMVLFEKGDIYVRVKKYDEALRNYTTARVVLNAHVMDSALLYLYCTGMANILFAQQNYLQAARFFKTKIATAGHRIKDPFLLFYAVQENMDNTGIGYFNAGMTDSAQYYYNATLNYINEQEKKFPDVPRTQFNIARGVVYSNQGAILRKKNDFNAAEKLFLESIESTKEYTDSIYKRTTALVLADMYLATNQVSKAGNILKSTIRPANLAEISNTAAWFYKNLYSYYTKTNEPVQAYYALLHSYNIRDSLEKRERLLSATDTQREFENKEQKIINQSLTKDNTIKNNYLLVAVASAVMALLIILLILYNIKRKSAYVSELTTLNQEVRERNEDLQKAFRSLELSHNENNRIMRIVAHDLKNPISAIRILVHSLLKREQTAHNKEILDLIQSTCIDSINLIKDLLNNKRSLKDISKELVDIGRLIEQCTELFKLKASEKINC